LPTESIALMVKLASSAEELPLEVPGSASGRATGASAGGSLDSSCGVSILEPLESFAALRILAHSMSNSMRSRLIRRLLTMVCRDRKSTSEVACSAAVFAAQETEGTGV